MDIHIHRLGVNFKIQEIRRRDTFGDKVFVGLHHRLVHVGAPEIPPVHEEELVAEGLLRRIRPAHESPQVHYRGVRGDIDHLPDHSGSQQVSNPELQAFGRLQDIDVPAVVDKGESGFRSREGDTGEFFDDMLELDVIRL